MQTVNETNHFQRENIPNLDTKNSPIKYNPLRGFWFRKFLINFLTFRKFA
jgi:hypothetical protein